eukprot:scpid84116/ scgid33265/ Leucine-rich repeat-containing protein C10orf11 homolog
MAMNGKCLSLAYRSLKHVPVEVVNDYFDRVESLDLTHNCMTELRSLMPFTKLTTLVLDHNQITSHVKFPNFPCLHTLWLNHNKITNLVVFIDQVKKSLPKLRFLSMMNNEASPSFFNGGSFEQFEDYRMYVVSHLPQLEMLDDKRVTDDERKEARKLYGHARSATRTASAARTGRKKSR